MQAFSTYTASLNGTRLCHAHVMTYIIKVAGAQGPALLQQTQQFTHVCCSSH